MRSAKPFDLWPRVPEALRTVLPNVTWDRQRLHALQLPTIPIAVADLRWQLALPWWRDKEALFSVCPNDVKWNPERYPTHWRRTLDADPSFPIHLLERDRLVVLDGVHRLLRADVLGERTIAAHVLSVERFADAVAVKDV